MDGQLSEYHDKSGVYANGRWTERYRQTETYFSSVLAWKPLRNWGGAYSLDYVYHDFHETSPTELSAQRQSLLQSLTTTGSIGALQLSGKVLLSCYDNSISTGKAAKNAVRVSPSVGANWKLFRERVALRTFYKDIFRMPTFSENYYYRLGNPNLTPERTHQWGLGMTWETEVASWWPVMSISADVYQNAVKDKIVSIPVNMHLWKTVNVAKVHGQGWEWVMASRFHVDDKHALFVNANGTWQQTKDKSNAAWPDYNKQLAYLPHFSGTMSLAWENPWLNMSLSATGVSSRWSSHEHAKGTRLPGYSEWTCSVWRTVEIGGMRAGIKASIMNLFDRQYDIVTGYPMPDRAYRIVMNIPI